MLGFLMCVWQQDPDSSVAASFVFHQCLGYHNWGKVVLCASTLLFRCSSRRFFNLFTLDASITSCGKPFQALNLTILSLWPRAHNLYSLSSFLLPKYIRHALLSLRNSPADIHHFSTGRSGVVHTLPEHNLQLTVILLCIFAYCGMRSGLDAHKDRHR